MSDLVDQQIVLFLDLLGFSEFTARSDTALQEAVLLFLTDIASLKSEFALTVTPTEHGKSYNVRPSISTFSDHIVASYSLAGIDVDDGDMQALIVISHIKQFVAAIAISALRLGFLIRGGVAFGKLYHTGGVVFGEALVEAASLESRSAVYPRVVLSSKADEFFRNHKVAPLGLANDFDGFSCVNYYDACIFHAAKPGESYGKEIQAWYSHVASLLIENLQAQKGTVRAKWYYFLRKLIAALEAYPPEVRTAWGIDLSKISAL